MLEDKDLLSIQEARRLVEVADRAGSILKTFPQEKIDRIVGAMAEAARSHAEALARLAVDETGRGRYEDKITKNLFAAVDIYRWMKDVKTCDVVREDPDKGIIEIAVPYGVIAVIVPTTNPTSTTIFKLLSAIKSRNTVVVAPHPQAVRCTSETARILDQAGRTEGLPEGAVNCMMEVTLEGTQELMRHRKTRLILATGGAGMVRAAYSSGKPAYGVGPGNVPSYIDRSADVPKAVRDIIAGKTFDWGLLCSSEQAIVCDAPVEAQVWEELRKNQAHILNPDEQAKLEKLIQGPEGRLNTAVVGQSPQKIAGMAGFSVGPEVVCLVGRAGGVGKEHPLSMEKLSPILGFFVVEGWEQGCKRCIEILSYGGLGHTMSIHAKDRDVVLQFGLHKPAHRICVNTPSTQGSVGLTTGLAPSMTLGCGSPGGNITSDNITALHLVNIRRLAYETRSVQEAGAALRVDSGRPPSVPVGDRDLRQVVRSVVEDYLGQKKKGSPRLAPNSIPIELTSPSGTSEEKLSCSCPEKPGVDAEPAMIAVDFVCEDDVRRAVRDGSKIAVHAKTIITPAARDAAEGKSVFLWV